MSLPRFFISFSVFTLIIGFAAYFIQYMAGTTPMLIPKFWVIFGALAMLTFIAYSISWYGMKQEAQISGFVVLGAIVIKLLFFMALVAFYLLKFKVDSILFVCNFFSLYFLFTGFEVYGLLSNLRHQNKN